MSCLTPPEMRTTFICILYYKHTHTHTQVRTLSSSHDCIQTRAEGHHHPSGLTRKQSPCTGRCNFLSHFPCMDSNYWSWARQRRQLLMHRYDNHWLIGQHISGGFGCQGWRDRWRKEKQGTAHRWTRTNACILSRGGYTLFWLAVSSSSLFLLFSTLCINLSQ